MLVGIRFPTVCRTKFTIIILKGIYYGYEYQILIFLKYDFNKVTIVKRNRKLYNIKYARLKILCNNVIKLNKLTISEQTFCAKYIM